MSFTGSEIRYSLYKLDFARARCPPTLLCPDSSTASPLPLRLDLTSPERPPGFHRDKLHACVLLHQVTNRLPDIGSPSRSRLVYRRCCWILAPVLFSPSSRPLYLPGRGNKHAAGPGGYRFTASSAPTSRLAYSRPHATKGTELGCLSRRPVADRGSTLRLQVV